jgi:protein involved in polysaccharide export with SLBB domain
MSRMLAFLLPILLLALDACSSGPPLMTSAPPVVASQDYRLGSGDRIRISLYGDASFQGEYDVGSDGTASLPLIGAQRVAGLTIAEFRALVERELANGFYREPRVSAEVVNFRPFYILGEVNRPGVYPYVSGMTLAQAVAVAGGYTYRANRGAIALRRAGEERAVDVAADDAMAIGPGDTIRVLERYF